MKKIFFLKFSLFLSECSTFWQLEKSIYNVRYRIFTNFIFHKIKLNILKKKIKFQKKYFFHNYFKIFFITLKILKMENKHPEHFWSAFNSLSENKKIFGFWNTLNHFIFWKMKFVIIPEDPVFSTGVAHFF